MSDFLVGPSKLSGQIAIPPSKSQSIRALLFAAMAEGESSVTNLLLSPDIDATIEACRQLGAKVVREGNTCRIVGVAGKPQVPDNVIDAGNSGLVLRFVSALAALTDGYTVITGDHSIRYNRAVQPLIDGLSGLGASVISTRGNGRPPLIIRGPLKAGRTVLEGSDSQPVSALLLAAMFLDGKTEIHITNPGEKPFLHMTVSWLKRFGVTVEFDESFTWITVQGPVIPKAFEYYVPGDFSSAAYPLVAALLTGSEITLTNLDFDDFQGDKMLFSCLQRMGAEIEIDRENKMVHVLSGGSLLGVCIDINDTIDAISLMAVVGCFAKGETHIVNGAIARQKECDRIHCITQELSKMGADIEQFDDGLVVKHSSLRGAPLMAHNDHRIALSLAVAGMAATGQTRIGGAGCVAKTFPTFSSQMQAMMADIQTVEAS
ncbi:MAG: 3-phosphoshikimate 1-carboxyvinyltransferase [Chlamydiales bacterium]|nr:3-phosphoshikimate 1-carboxyvinyltransferase [Chlamydiales bacterium]